MTCMFTFYIGTRSRQEVKKGMENNFNVFAQIRQYLRNSQNKQTDSFMKRDKAILSTLSTDLKAMVLATICNSRPLA